MAQKEIVLQQVRMGKQRDLPLALEKGQIGFSTDVGRVFIGLPSSSEPASLVAGRTWDTEPDSGQENVEILTEFTPTKKLADLINKPVVIDVPAGDEVTTYISTNTRIFVDYVGYAIDSPDFIETGTAQMVLLENKVMLYQNNNTTFEESILYLEFKDPEYESNTNRTKLTIKNSYTESMRIEFLIRSWK